MKKYLVGGLACLAAVALMGQGCEDDIKVRTAPSGTQAQASQTVEQNQQKLMNAVPLPKLDTSAERKNVVRRLESWDDENKVGYVYLVSYGKVMAFYTVKGKVSSLNSYLVPNEQLIRGNGEKCSVRESSGDLSAASSWEPCYTVSSPDLDGTYGENDNGIFFFTTEGAYVEWKGEYMFVDQPLKLTTPPELVREIK